MVECEKCGKPIDEGMKYCPECEAKEAVIPLKDEFNVLYDIDRFDVFEEDKFQAKKKRKKKKKRLMGLYITLAVLIVSFVEIKWAINKSASYDELVAEDKPVVQQAQELVNPEEKEETEEVISVDDEVPADGGNDIGELKETVMKFCNRYNNRQTLYEGELIATVPNRKTISATYHIPKVISVEERDAVKELEEDIKEAFLNETKDDFPEEITVNVKIMVSYR